MKNIKKFKFALVILMLTMLISCGKDEQTNLSEPTFHEIEEMVHFHGDKKSDIIIVNTQGGPVTELEDETIEEFIKASETKNILYLNVHQAQTKDPDRFNKSLTFEQAKSYDKESVRTLKSVIDYCKKYPGKKVYVLGISFGAFMAQELIAEYGVDIADGYLISVGRLDIDEKTWTAFSKGDVTRYIYNSSDDTYEIEKETVDNITEKNMAKMAAGLGYNRYTQRLASINDLSKVTYVYGDKDEQVGPMSSEELKFLKDKKAAVKLIQGGDHDKAINKTIEMLKEVFKIK